MGLWVYSLPVTHALLVCDHTNLTLTLLAAQGAKLLNALPHIAPSETVSSDTQQYLQQLSQSSFSGDIEFSYASRMAVATDNSVYQQIPQAVVFPKNVDDLQSIAKAAGNNEAITFSARGGGTGTNGQSLTPGIVVDTSRYMNQIVELNVKEQWVIVESGVVKDALNDYLAPHGYFFSPDLSTSNRATVGGMISTDASGQGSLVYGKTSDHLLALDAVLANGEYLQTSPVSLEDAEKIAASDSWQAKLYRQVIATSAGEVQYFTVDGFNRCCFRFYHARRMT